MKTFLIVSLVIHGLIHFSGFGRLWGMFNSNGRSMRALISISQTDQKVVGLFWLAALLLFLLTAAGLIIGYRYWWILLMVAILISEILVVLFWKDAMAGTLVNLLLCIPVVMAIGNWQFERIVSEEIRHISLNGKREYANDIITEASIKHLPDCVQKWLSVSGAVDRKRPRLVYLTQRAQIRTEPDKDWMNADAEQIFNLNEPGFIWKVKVNSNGLIWYSGRDKLEHGSGNMLIRLYSTIPIVNSSGPEIDQGTLLRFLGELCWIPSAATSSYISWESVGDRAAKATISLNGKTAAGIFTYDANGKILSFSAQRYMLKDGRWTLENWYIPCREWAVKDGYKIPVKGEVIWKLKEGDFAYYRWEIEKVTYR
jgi:hypothetical protein